ncbi:MAG: OmpA family protein, partial [Campylobacteraceae bacterium]|nr:OmpA family protein [Campylobacteraceae bacterium]
RGAPRHSDERATERKRHSTKAQLQQALDSLKVDANQTKASLDAARVLLQKQAELLDEEASKLKLSMAEVEALKEMLLDVETQKTEAKTQLKSLKSELLSTQGVLALKESEVALLGKKLLDKTLAHQKLVEDLDLTKARIQNLTGIRIKVIASLKEKLGDAVDVDSGSGAIRLPSNVLFDVGEHELRPEAKAKLRQALMPYFEVLLKDENVRENIDRIIIEGHTDSTGSYMYNLDLSQRRAQSVMGFIYTWEELDTDLLQKYLSASGRSYSDRIYKNKEEDKESSRRIEIKFSISNTKAVKEIETFLKGSY